MEKLPLSVCYIVKNEELFISASLRSVLPLAQEVIVVDTGSTDKTVQIAENFGCRMAHFTWRNDFSMARNFAAELATAEWILFVDGDEILEASAYEKLKTAISNPTIASYGLIQRNYTRDRSHASWVAIEAAPISEICTLASACEGFVDNVMPKLYRNFCGIRWEGLVHETVVHSAIRLGFLHGEAPIVLHHLKEMKGQEFNQSKKQYYLQLAIEKLKRNPDHENPWFEAGISLSEVGQYAAAEKAFEEALRRRPDWAEAKLYRARLLLQLDRFSDAEVLLADLLTSNEFVKEALAHLSTALLFQKRFSECEAVIEKGLQVWDDSLVLNINAATLYFEQGQFQKSLKHIVAGLELNPRDEFLLQAKTKAETAISTDQPV